MAGTVEEIGAGVDSWRVGDSVCALVSGGGYAEFCAAPAVQCLPAESRAEVRRPCGATVRYPGCRAHLFLNAPDASAVPDLLLV